MRIEQTAERVNGIDLGVLQGTINAIKDDPELGSCKFRASNTWVDGFLGLEPDVPKDFTNIRMKFKVRTDEENLGRLRKLAAFSPVYNTLVQGAKVDIDIQPM